MKQFLALLTQQNQGDLAGFRASIAKAIAISSKHLPSDHPNFAILYNNLAHICIDEGNVSQAVDLWRKSYSIRLKALGKEHPYARIDAEMLRKYDPNRPLPGVDPDPTLASSSDSFKTSQNNDHPSQTSEASAERPGDDEGRAS